jgi:metal-responsive CopG/Arc/MetJ family transcriptional regulator
MKTKTSVTLSNEILAQLNNITSVGNRSDFVEKALWRYIELLQREKRNQDDLNIINKVSASLNKEAEDTLLYQVGK